jgi:hypothetical protein
MKVPVVDMVVRLTIQGTGRESFYAMKLINGNRSVFLTERERYDVKKSWLPMTVHKIQGDICDQKT